MEPATEAVSRSPCCLSPRGDGSEPGLADTGFSREQQESATASVRIRERPTYVCEFPLPAYEATRPLMRFAVDRPQSAKRAWALLLDGEKANECHPRDSNPRYRRESPPPDDEET